MYFHIKIDTGMGRIGFPVNEESADAVARISRLPNAVSYTHLDVSKRQVYLQWQSLKKS